MHQEEQRVKARTQKGKGAGKSLKHERPTSLVVAVYINISTFTYINHLIYQSSKYEVRAISEIIHSK